MKQLNRGKSADNYFFNTEKLMSHLNLLRNEYIKLQKRFFDLQQQYEILKSSTSVAYEENFISRLLQTIDALFDSPKYADIQVKLADRTLNAHKFVLEAHSDGFFQDSTIFDGECLNLSEYPAAVGQCLMQYLYNNTLSYDLDRDTIVIPLMRIAKKFNLSNLLSKCEHILIAKVDLNDVILFYQLAEELQANKLKAFCSDLILENWERFTTADFENLSSEAAYALFKSRTGYPLHKAIDVRRDDALFLFLIEFSATLSERINERDDKGRLPLEMALSSRQEEVALTLVQNGADVNLKDDLGFSLLHTFILKGDCTSATFMVNQNCDLDLRTQDEQATALHLIASLLSDSWSEDEILSFSNLIDTILSREADVNALDINSNTPLHRAILSFNEPIFFKLLSNMNVSVDLLNKDGCSPMWLVIESFERTQDANKKKFLSDAMSALAERGYSLTSTDNDGNTLLHKCLIEKYESGANFLITHWTEINQPNREGSTPLHLAASNGLVKFCRVLLDHSANPNLQTYFFPNKLTLQTPLHQALMSEKRDLVEEFLNWASDRCSADKKSPANLINFTIQDSNGESPLSLAIWLEWFEIASKMIQLGANVDAVDSDGFSLIHKAILRQRSNAALFLLNNVNDLEQKLPTGQSLLQHAVERHLPLVVEALCKKVVSFDNPPYNPLWTALSTGQEDIASILVRHGCDTNCWDIGPNNCMQTLLHRAIDENNEPVACFLIRSQCDVDSPRCPGPNGELPEEASDLQTPLHLACQWGLTTTVSALLEHGARINLQDSDGNTPLHIAVMNHHNSIVDMLLSMPDLHFDIENKQKMIPFSIALTSKNEKAIKAIMTKKPKAAEQIDSKGLNFLHRSILKSDLEAVLFLISSGVDVNSRTKDSHQYTPLHLAARTGSEIILRNLLLGGAAINSVTSERHTALHIAAEQNHPVICSVLIDKGIDDSAVDINCNNALHTAVRQGNYDVFSILLLTSSIDVTAINVRSMNVLHLLGQYGKQNSLTLFDLLIKSFPMFPIDTKDGEGNTALLLAYMNGNGPLCRALVEAGACLGSCNDHGISIFNHPVATKTLLYSLLDALTKEPPWSNADSCLECGIKFTMTMRRHHCRHCGRVLCKKCSELEIPVLKYGNGKSARVCHLCFDFLTLGVNGMP